MTDEELIEEIARRCRVIRDLLIGCHPDADYFAIFIKNGRISFNNDYWEKDFNISYTEAEEEE